MPLNVDLRFLNAAVRRMRAESIEVGLVIDVRKRGEAIDILDLELGRGKVIKDLGEVKARPNGRLTYRDRDIVLYIEDHSWRVEAVIRDPTEGRRVHVADCATLDHMRGQGRFERYVVTSDTNGDFVVTGWGKDGRSVEERAKLSVCKNCLRKLNYKNYAKKNRESREKVFDDFGWETFFAKYRTSFSTKPSRHAGTSGGGYTRDWHARSLEYRKAKGFRCELCRVYVIAPQHRRLLHVHHINGVKTDNRGNNLRALCALCHRREHRHLHVPEKDAALIQELRAKEWTR